MSVRTVKPTRRERQPRRPVQRTRPAKGALREIVRRGSRSDRSPRVSRKVPGYGEPTACERCGAIYLHKAWRQRADAAPELMMRASWDICPACRQIAHGQFFGRVVIRDAQLPSREEAILRRVTNVAERAEFTQPERRIVEVRRQGDALEVQTTSQKLAHRIARELVKAFGGHARFAWSDRDGALYATWESG